MPPAAQAVALPYGAGRYRALLVLPADASPAGLAALASAPGAAPLRALRAALRPARVALSLPRFRLEYGVASLAKPLRAMGLAPAFDAGPNDGPNGTGGFALLSDDPEVHLSDVLHKAVLEVTEEGTVAAAATVAVMATRSMPAPPERVTFDRPFLLALEEVDSGAPLFLGAVVRPRFD